MPSLCVSFNSLDHFDSILEPVLNFILSSNSREWDLQPFLELMHLLPSSWNNSCCASHWEWPSAAANCFCPDYAPPRRWHEVVDSSNWNVTSRSLCPNWKQLQRAAQLQNTLLSSISGAPAHGSSPPSAHSCLPHPCKFISLANCQFSILESNY